MKFKNKKSGAIFDYKDYLFCGQYDGYCPNCPIYPNLGNFTGGRPADYCDEWISAHLNEAAELMGYEIIDETPLFLCENDGRVTRKGILRQAEKCVWGDREQDYGTPEYSLSVIGNLWTAYINGKFGTSINLKGSDASAMMVLFKMARVATGHNKEDNWCDAAGYAACGGELEGREASEN